MKEAKYCCATCGVKQSKAKGKEVKVNVHHKSGIDNWAEVMLLIRAKLLNKDDMEVLCVSCHDDLHKAEREEAKEEAK